MPDLRACFLAASALLVPSLALAAAFGHKAGTESYTEPSGRVAAHTADAVASADYYGLQVFKMWEYAGKGCVLDIEQSAFATRSLSRLSPLKVCEPTVGEQWKLVDVGSGLFITAIATCTSKTKDDSTVHGIELWGAALGDDGKLTPSKKSVKLEFGACKKWQPKRACPEGQVATGVRAFFDDDASGLQGLALRCHSLEPRGK